jgi:hypothetical protein
MTIPEIKLPYETFIHKEAYIPNALYVAQPVGKLSCIWFTLLDGNPICYLIEIKDRQLSKKYSISTVFDTELVGTVLQGTYMHYESQPCFVIHNIFYYKNIKVTCNYQEKCGMFEEMLEKYIWNEKMKKNQCMFFLPETSFRIENINASYNIFCIKIIDLVGNKIMNYIDETVLKPFLVQSTDIKDIYEIYTLDNIFHSIAHIDTCKCSKMLNTLFRKEILLDSIEDSEDETESFPIKSIKMYCKWNEMYKKWIPIKII